MNYYEQHIGDYAKDAGHLSMVEDGAYRRLMDAYYTRERALPIDTRECFKLARANTKPERDAVLYVLREFFTAEDDGYHQKRCDEEIERYLEAEPEREQKRENAKERQRRARARRAELFNQLRELGITPAWDASTHELEGHLSRVTKRDNSQPVTRDNTATHTHSPVTNKHQEQKQAPSSASPQDPTSQNDDDAPVPGEQDLPAWVPKPLWREFYRHRAVIRKPLSIPGQRQVVARLIELSEGGHDIASSLRQTMAAGLAIPVTPQARAGPNGRPTADSKTLTGLKKLQALKTHETLPARLAQERDSGRSIEAPDAEP